MFGPDHQYTLVSANNRSIYLRLLGRVDEGLEAAESTLEKIRAAFGEEHPMSLSCALDTANARADHGDLDGAEALEWETPASFRRVLGASHPDTLFCAC